MTDLPTLESDLRSSVASRPDAPSLARTVIEQIGNYRKHPESRDALRAEIVKNIDRILDAARQGAGR